MNELKELEKALPKGWVWEAGNYLRDLSPNYWAQAFGPEVNSVHEHIWGEGDTLEEAFRDLTKNVRGWKRVTS